MSVKIDPDTYRVREGEGVDLTERPTLTDPLYASKGEYESRLATELDRLRELQKLLYAADSHALLVVLQGMDTAGKDGVIRHVMSGLNPQGVDVHSFRPPSEEELHHDFLWRANRVLPARGRIGVFNRSYYEEVLVVRVHPEQLAGEGLSAAPDQDFWRGRYRAMVEMERHLDASRTRVVKFFLHLSVDEQRKRLLARIDEPDKNWKFNLTDIAERALWPDYMRAYADCLSATSTDRAPWYVVPSDDKRNQRLIVAAILRSTMEAMKLRYPKVDKRRREELEAIRRELQKQSPRGRRAGPG